jgi:hypothetical protein
MKTFARLCAVVAVFWPAIGSAAVMPGTPQGADAAAVFKLEFSEFVTGSRLTVPGNPDPKFGRVLVEGNMPIDTFTVAVPFDLQTGAIILTDGEFLPEGIQAGGSNSDVIRWVAPAAADRGRGTTTETWIKFYSDSETGISQIEDDPASDVGLPGDVIRDKANLMAQDLVFEEQFILDDFGNPTGDDGLQGYKAGTATYDFISDAPEPSGHVLASLGAIGMVVYGWCRRPSSANVRG